MESINTFSGGQNSDISKTIQNKESYLQALNFRNITSLGNSNGSLVNIKGNQVSLTYPELKESYKLIVGSTGTGTVAGIVTIAINGQTTASISIDAGTTGFDLYSQIIKLNNAYTSTNGTPSTPTFAIAYDNDYVIIYQQPVYLLGGVSSITPAITVTLSNAGAATHSIYFESNGVNYTTQSGHHFVKGATNLITIGSGYIDNDIYLLTAENNDTETAPHPNDTFSNIGAIWKLSINDVTRITTLTLVYNNYLDFTKIHPVSPTAILGRYESTAIQRLYWTDFYNSIKVINIADPNLQALSPALISVFASTSFEVPILKGFLAGSLNHGSYELGYRLTKSAGPVSNYSQVSNIVSLLGDESTVSGANYLNYEGPSGIGNSGRGIEWNVYNLDTNWDFVEFVVLYRNTKTDLPVVYRTNPIAITTTSPYVYTLTSITALNIIDFEEYQQLASGFTHAKTVETKDNILFWGNTKAIAQKSIDELFDARAFRSDGSSNILLTNNGVNSSVNLATAKTLPKTNDVINEYYDNTGVHSSRACYYKPTTPTILGGEGANISYEFGAEQIVLTDLSITEAASGDWLLDANNHPYDFPSGGPIGGMTNPIDLITSTGNSDNQTYPISGIGSAKNPYFTSVMRGYQNEEIYRFAIQFFDLQGLPYFAEWIGDIKMPAYYDTCSNRTQLAIDAGITTFQPSFHYNDTIYGQVLYIKFTVDVSAVATYISGYRIVRVERKKDDKSILGTGLLTNVYYDDTTSTEAVIGGGLWRALKYFDNPLTVHNYGIPYNPRPDQYTIETIAQFNGTPNTMSISNRMLTFDCFDFQIEGYGFSTNDKILVRADYQPINWLNAKNGVANARYRSAFTKLSEWLAAPNRATTLPSGMNPVFDGARYVTGYDSEVPPIYWLFHTSTTSYDYTSSSNTYIIAKGMSVGAGSSVTSADTGITNFWNYMRTWGPDVDGSHPGQGCATTLLNFDSGQAIASATTYGMSSSNGGKLLGLYFRYRRNQYGGNTYSARSFNEYISCGSFIPLTRENIPLNNNKISTFKCYGGDIFTNNWDLQKIIKDIAGTEFKHYDWDSSNITNPTGGAGNNLGLTTNHKMRFSNMFFLPTQNTFNQAVRYGEHFNKNLTDDIYYYPGAIERYYYNPYHSNEPTTTKFFPKPLNFIVSSEWRNRVYYSNVKIDNEIEDSWSVYSPNNFYDVEGNYGGITSLVALNQNLYYIQERGVGVLLVNPVSMVTDATGFPIKLGAGTGIQKHFYKVIDSGSKHQWSVNRSQNLISFIDIRQKKIYTFNGEQLNPISDTKGQRNFVIKRLHDNLLINDNPIIGKGIMSVYDYQNHEFLYTFKNISTTPNTAIDENYTLLFSESLNNFVGMSNCLPNIYISNHKYLLSGVNTSSNASLSLWLHNYGEYGKFYNTLYPSTLKLLVNDNPLYTKVFDNLVINSEAVKDNIEWSDDLNIYPGAITSVAYPDDVNYKDTTFNSIRCYNQYQNTDWTTLTTGSNIKKIEQSFNLALPRNKFNYDTTNPSVYSIFDSSKLTKTTFGERLRDKWLIIDLSFPNTSNLRFIIHNIKTLFRISDR